MSKLYKYPKSFWNSDNETDLSVRHKEGHDYYFSRELIFSLSNLIMDNGLDVHEAEKNLGFHITKDQGLMKLDQWISNEIGDGNYCNLIDEDNNFKAELCDKTRIFDAESYKIIHENYHLFNRKLNVNVLFKAKKVVKYDQKYYLQLFVLQLKINNVVMLPKGCHITNNIEKYLLITSSRVSRGIDRSGTCQDEATCQIAEVKTCDDDEVNELLL
jgi:hypothetical protein